MNKIVTNPSENKLNPENKLKGNKPNENSGVNITTHLKISDPNTGQVLVQKRGDT
jgi:hypothetical protein